MPNHTCPLWHGLRLHGREAAERLQRFRQLPPALIDCMKRAKRGGNRAELDRLGREAAALVEARPPRTGAQAAYQSIARQLGEGGAA